MPVKISVRKTRRLRALLAKHYKLPEPPDPQESMMEDVMMTVLWKDAPPARARLAFVNLTDEFADWNELRVSLTSEVALVLESCGLKGDKAPVLKRLLGRAIEEFYSFEYERLCEVSPARLKAWFLEVEGLPYHILASILYRVYRYERVLVSAGGCRVIRRLGLVSATAEKGKIEEAMSAVVPAKEAHFIHHALRRHAKEVCTKTAFDCTACRLRAECATRKKRLAEAKAARAAKTAKRAKRRARAAAKAKKAAKPTKKRAAKAATKRAAPKSTPKRTTKSAAKKSKS